MALKDWELVVDKPTETIWTNGLEDDLELDYFKKTGYQVSVNNKIIRHFKPKATVQAHKFVKQYMRTH